MKIALAAFLAGLRAVARAPGLLLGIFALTIAVAAPFGIAVFRALDDAIGSTEMADFTAIRLPVDWWDSFIAHASGPAATFTPAILGFAAPLDNLSAVLDATPRPLAAIVPAVIYGALWPLVWGAVLARFARDDHRGIRAFFRSGFATLGPMFRLAIGALAAYAVLFLVLHPLLFGPLYDWLTLAVDTEPAALAIRLLLYAFFGATLAGLSLVVDFTRIFIVLDRRRCSREALKSARAFLRRRGGAALIVYALSGGLFLVVLLGYAVFDLRARGVPRVWTAIVIGQLFIVARLAVRLVTAAAEVRLVQHDRSTAAR